MKYQLISMKYQLISMKYQLISMKYQLISMKYQLISMMKPSQLVNSIRVKNTMKESAKIVIEF